jgi:hypothetical protein
MSSLNLLMLSTDQELRKLLYLLGVDGRSTPSRWHRFLSAWVSPVGETVDEIRKKLPKNWV